MDLAQPAIEAAAFSAADIRAARAAAIACGRPLIEMLEETSGLAPDQFVARLAGSFSVSPISANEMHALAPAFDIVPFADATRRDCVAFRDDGGTLVLALADPFCDPLRVWAESCIAEPFAQRLAHLSNIRAFLARHEETVRAMEGVVGGEAATAVGGSPVEDLSLKAIHAHASPVVKLVHSTLYDALKVGASDVHLETTPAGLSIKYRIDGVLAGIGSAPGLEFAEQVISRVKVMAELDIAERRVPQDGRFKVTANGREVDFRVSIMPSIFGEDAVLRLLDKSTLADQLSGLRLDQLGFDPATIAILRRMSAEPYGMVLVTGPTGSGKTTTLYAAISEINLGEDKIVTIEDPVEYQLPGVLQIPVNEKKGLTFARGLRSILRHDPDKIMVGEIRDEETAQIAVQAALTGHLVFTTVHANSVFDVIGRFLHMGVDPVSFVSALNGIVAQRLIRLVCPHCAADLAPDAALIEASGLSPEASAGFRFRTGRGCGQCHGSGYKGRKAVAEVLHLNDEIRELIAARVPTRQLKEAAQQHGTRLLRDGALDLVRSGETTLQEVNRVTFVG